MNNHPVPTKGIEPVVSLSTRLSPDVMAVLDRAVAEMGCTQRAAVEYAIKFAYGPEAQEDDEEARQREEEARELLKVETKATYIAAVQDLFALLALSDADKGPDHKAQVMEANNACGITRLAMIEAWEGDLDG